MQAQQIVRLALAIAKGPGMLQYGGQQLNLVLEDLYKVRNLQVNRVTQSITATVGTYGPFPLEADYLRTYDLFYPIPAGGGGTGGPGGITQFLVSITMEKFDSEFKNPSVAAYPYEFACDLSVEAQTWSGTPLDSTLLSAGGLYIYPQSSGTITLTHRYMVRRDDIVNPETSTTEPWFTYHDYLVQATAWRMMQITGDDRVEQTRKTAEEMLRPYLISGEGDEQKAVHSVQRDPTRFRPSRGLRPVKAYPF